MEDVFRQYADLIAQRTAKVETGGPEGVSADMRTGWLVWERSLVEFIYFEERMLPPDPNSYVAEWHENRPRGARKASKSLWVFDKNTGQKAYSVTTSAGIKIQPYFDVPPPRADNVYYFRVQSEPIGQNIVLLWVMPSTARQLEERLGTLDVDIVSSAILEVVQGDVPQNAVDNPDEDLAVAIRVSVEAHGRLAQVVNGVSDEHRVQLLLKALA